MQAASVCSGGIRQGSSLMSILTGLYRSCATSLKKSTIRCAAVIDVTENKFVLSYRLSNDDLVILDLEDEFAKSERQTINFEKFFR